MSARPSPKEKPVSPAWPYLTAEMPAVPARFKQRGEDFVVEEVPLYHPCGEGDHTYVTIEKEGLTTRRAVLDIARALGVPPSSIGVAGQKDARGIARQLLSVERVEPSRIRSLALPGIRILDVARHRTKLRVGWLRGNRFAVRLREVPTTCVGEVRAVLDLLARRGVPNYFGAQRFGMRGDTWEVGRSLLAGDFASAEASIVGRPLEGDPVPVRRARELAAARRYREAAAAWPREYADCARLCRALEAADGDPRRAIFRLDRSALSLYVSAYQAWLFNRVLARRVPGIDRLLPGDIAVCHRSGLCSLVLDTASEEPRAGRFEISPTGPMVGFAMSKPEGEAGVVEATILADAGCSPDALPRSGPLACVGGRRPLRFRAEELGAECGTDAFGPYLELRFALPPGSYATALLREICKGELRETFADQVDA